MSVDGNLKVVFGPSPNEFLIMYGRRMTCTGMPPGLVETIMQHINTDLDPMKVSWIAVHPEFQMWAIRTTAGAVWSGPETPEWVTKLLAGGEVPNQDTTARALSFTADGNGLFMKRGGAELVLETDESPAYGIDLGALRAEVPALDTRMRNILFGCDGTHICTFDKGFLAFLKGPAEDPSHPLRQACMAFDGNCTVLDGSALCPYDDRYFMLRVLDGDQVRMRWYLPDGMRMALEKLMEQGREPAEQAALQQYTLNQIAVMNNNMLIQQAQIQMSMQQTRMMANIMTQGAQNIANAASGSHGHWQWRY